MKEENIKDLSSIKKVSFESFNNQEFTSEDHPLNGLMMEED